MFEDNSAIFFHGFLHIALLTHLQLFKKSNGQRESRSLILHVHGEGFCPITVIRINKVEGKVNMR